MATITKRSGRLLIEWNKNAPNDLIYHYEVTAVIADDSEDGGEKEVKARVTNVGTRTTFRGLTGTQIENDWKSETDDALQDLGSGAGGHTLVDDFGS